jgi:hypothetical protein
LKKKEELTKATHSMIFAVSSLQESLKDSTAVESLVLLDLIETAVKLQKRIESFADAIQSS